VLKLADVYLCNFDMIALLLCMNLTFLPLFF